MAKQHFDFTADPTFKAKVDIPIPGKKAKPVEFTFKYRTKEEYEEFKDSLAGRDEVDLVLDVASNWEIENHEFGEESLKKMFSWSPGAASAILRKYIEECMGAKLGN